VLEHQLSEQYKWTHNPTHLDAKEQLERAPKMWERAIENMEVNLDTSEMALAKLHKDLDDVSYFCLPPW
jgi:hypothetical protein